MHANVLFWTGFMVFMALSLGSLVTVLGGDFFWSDAGRASAMLYTTVCSIGCMVGGIGFKIFPQKK